MIRLGFDDPFSDGARTKIVLRFQVWAGLMNGYILWELSARIYSYVMHAAAPRKYREASALDPG